METKTSSQWLFTPTDHILKSHLHSLGFLQRLLMSCNFFSFFLFPFVFIGFLGLGYPLFFCFFFSSFLSFSHWFLGLVSIPTDYRHQTHSKITRTKPIKPIYPFNKSAPTIPIQLIYLFNQYTHSNKTIPTKNLYKFH